MRHSLELYQSLIKLKMLLLYATRELPHAVDREKDASKNRKNLPLPLALVWFQLDIFGTVIAVVIVLWDEVVVETGATA